MSNTAIMIQEVENWFTKNIAQVLGPINTYMFGANWKNKQATTYMGPVKQLHPPEISIIPKGNRKNLTFLYDQAWETKASETYALLGQTTLAKAKAKLLITEDAFTKPEELEKALKQDLIALYYLEAVENRNVAYYPSTKYYDLNYNTNTHQVKLKTRNNRVILRVQELKNHIPLDTSKFNLTAKEAPKKAAANKMKKWSCACTIVRTSGYLVAKCQFCDKQFVAEEDPWLTNEAYDVLEKTIVYRADNKREPWFIQSNKSHVRNLLKVPPELKDKEKR